MNLRVCAHGNQKDALDIDHRCWDGMVQAEFGQNLWIWKKCIKMVPLQSNPSFFSIPKLYWLGIFFVVVFFLISFYCAAVMKIEHKIVFIVFSTSGSHNLLFVLCLSAILKGVSPGHLRVSHVLCTSLFPFIC